MLAVKAERNINVTLREQTLTFRSTTQFKQNLGDVFSSEATQKPGCYTHQAFYTIKISKVVLFCPSVYSLSGRNRPSNWLQKLKV